MTSEELPSGNRWASTGPLAKQYAVGDVWVVAARGEVDLNNLPPLTKALTQAAETHATVVLDASGITFADSTFLNLLLRIHQATDLRIAAPGPQLERLLDLTGADGVLHLRPSVDEATTR
ncbi:STAS domain-containing protein [Streptomyces sp. CA-251247]|uniref:STAS domain-containing protein n=1 Tax=Streptomyces sp. CA-251247 TaxID=3240062 RepID=UPI003D8F973B